MTDAKMEAPIGNAERAERRTGLTITGIPVFAKKPPLKEEPAPEKRQRLTMGSEQNFFVREEELGRGGMGVVYKARHVVLSKEGETVMNKRVALKEILLEDSEFGSDPEIAEARKKKLYSQLLSEVQTASNLENENIVKILNFGYTDDGRPFYVMEYLEGVDLLTHLSAKKTLDWETTREIMLQVCSALIAAHEFEVEKSDGAKEKRPIIHRDLKPENIFLTRDNKSPLGRVKVLDFGLAKMLSPKKSEDDTVKTDGVHGTPNSMAPEQWQGLDVDHRADIYALGCVMYEMLTGSAPFPLEKLVVKGPGDFKDAGEYQKYFSEKLNDLAHMVFEKKPATIKTVVHEVNRIVLKCLEKAPEARYQSVQELWNDIDKCRIINRAVTALSPDGESRIPTMEEAKVVVRQSILNGPTPGTPTPITTGSDEMTLVGPPPVSSESPWAQHAAGQIDVDALPSSHMPQQGEPLSQKQIPTMIVRTPLSNQETQVVPRPGLKKSRKLLYAALGIAGLAAVSGGVVGVARTVRSGDQPEIRQPVTEPVRVNPPVQQADPLPRTPQTQPSTPVVQDPQPVQRSFTITVRTEPRAVQVIMGGSVVCNGTGNCQITMPQGTEPVELTFRKAGYREATESVVPDQDRTFEVRLERIRRLPGPQDGQQVNPVRRPGVTSPD
jgi:serine/threonine protein kinase